VQGLTIWPSQKKEKGWVCCLASTDPVKKTTDVTANVTEMGVLMSIKEQVCCTSRSP